MKNILILILASIQCVVFAESLMERQSMKEGQEGIDERLKSLNTTCKGPNLKVSVDWKSFSQGWKEEKKYAAFRCKDVIGGFSEVCDKGEMEKEELAKQIHSLVCHFEPKPARSPSGGFNMLRFEKKGSEMHVYIPNESANLQEQARDWLLKSL